MRFRNWWSFLLHLRQSDCWACCTRGGCRSKKKVVWKSWGDRVGGPHRALPLADEVRAREPLWERRGREGTGRRVVCHLLCCSVRQGRCRVTHLLLPPLQFGIEDLKALPDQTGCWDGVRNYQVRPWDKHRVLPGAWPCYPAMCSWLFFMPILACRHATSWGKWKRVSWLSFIIATARSPASQESWRYCRLTIRTKTTKI